VNAAHLVSGRWVFTYEPNGWPAGLLTGYMNKAGGAVLEHVVAFPHTPRLTVVKMLRAALEEAWARDYPYVVFHLPADHPQHDGLAALGTRCGFHEYATTWWTAHHP
jgi:hypothetical protein